MAGAVKTVMISERAESLMPKGSVIAGKAGCMKLTPIMSARLAA